MSARILVVDDNPLNLKLLAARLSHEYYIVSTATDGVAALEHIEKEKPDLILLDIMMPRMDGFETCRRIKENPDTTYIPVIIVTALSDVTDRVKGLEVGADDFLTKPINDLALMARVRSLLRFKMILDEWRMRESLTTQTIGPDENKRAEPAVEEKDSVLLIEDNPVDQKHIADTLMAHNINVVSVGTLDQAAALAQEGTFNLIYASLNLKDNDGLKLCPLIRSNDITRLLPILLIANEEEVARISKGLDLGANDYIMRPIDPNELLARTHTQLKQKHLYDRLRKNLEDGLSLALVDPLTGIFNRRYMDARLPKAVIRSQRSSTPVAVLMIDVDRFKLVNDTYGHSAGDLVLKEIAKILQNNVRPFDLLARMGGEEFIIVMPETTLASASMVGERLRKCIAETQIVINANNTKILATVSIGCAEMRFNEAETAEKVIDRADKALYTAKQSGRNCVITFQEDTPS